MLLRRCFVAFSPTRCNTLGLKTKYSRHATVTRLSSSAATEPKPTKKDSKGSEKGPQFEVVLPKYFNGPVKNVDSSSSNLYVAHRTHNCGELRKEHVGQKVTIAGWVQFHRVEGKFLVIRDGYGSVQAIISEEKCKPEWNVGNLKLESVIKLTGTVLERPPGQNNPKMATGDIEIDVDDVELLGTANSKLPITVREKIKATELVRMTYRYLDLRFPEMQSRMRFRSAMLAEMRKFLGDKCGFVEVETPTLFKRTPGGAQEFIVPSRMAGKCYTLVQSPQQFKQLLMVGGIDRYYQVARCYRDETARPDRQLEFTQLDIELSFSNQEGVMALAEDLISQCWRATVQPDLPFDRFPVMKFNDVYNDYGTDKPDIRFDMKIQNLSDLVKPVSNLYSRVLKSVLDTSDSTIAAIVVPKGQDAWHSKSSINKLSAEQLKLFTSTLWLRGFQVPNVQSDPWPNMGESSEFMETLRSNLGPKCSPGDVVWIAAGPKVDALALLGRLRLIAADELEKATGVSVRRKGPSFLWVVDFPLFEPGENPGTLKPSHHPFTHPLPEDAHMLFTDPLKVRGQHYDLVLDGWEIGGGSVRIHNAEMQRRVLGDLLKIAPDSLQHMLDALDSGCPPHAGIAFGIDRLIAVACGAPSIRDVIAFPKAAGGRDPMSGAPVQMTKQDQLLYHIHCTSSKDGKN